VTDLIAPGTWLAWAASLALGFPLAVVALGELGAMLERRGAPLAAPLGMLRVVLLPTLVVVLFLHHVLGLGPDHVVWRVFATLFWLSVIHATLSFLNLVLFADARETSWRSRVPPLLRDLSRFFLVLLGAAIVLSQVWGVDLGAMLTALGVGSIVIGLALQDTLKNVFAGIALLAENPLREGDWVQVDDVTGRVVNANWRAVHIETSDRELLVIPNLVLNQRSIKNFSADPVHAERVSVAFAGADRPNRVKAVLEAACRDIPWLAAGHDAQVQVRSHEQDSITYEVTLFVDSYENAARARDQFTTRLWYAARRGGLTPYLPDGGGGDAMLARLCAVPAIAGVDPSVLESMLPGTKLLHFGAGEHVIRQGEHNEALYIILSGVASVYVEDEQGRGEELAQLHRGQFFGEIGMLGSGSTTAFVRAHEDLEVAALSEDAVQLLLDHSPSLARALSETAESRRRANPLVAAGGPARRGEDQAG